MSTTRGITTTIPILLKFETKKARGTRMLFASWVCSRWKHPNCYEGQQWETSRVWKLKVFPYIGTRALIPQPQIANEKPHIYTSTKREQIAAYGIGQKKISWTMYTTPNPYHNSNNPRFLKCLWETGKSFVTIENHWNTREPAGTSYLAGIGADDRVAVAAIGRVLVHVVLVGAEDVIGSEIESLWARVGPTRRTGRH